MTTKTTKRKRKHPRPIRRRPQSGWRLVDHGDMNQLDPLHLREARCDLCGHELRFINLLEHPDWPEDLLVGNGCAERLTNDE